MIDRPIWIAMIAKLCCPQDQAGAARAMLAYLPMLADFPAPAFTARSAEAVARQNRHTPSYAQLRDSLADWWRDNAPRQTAIGQHKPQGWTDADGVWLDYYRKREAAGFPTVREHVESLVRTHSRLAWQVITEGRRA